MDHPPQDWKEYRRLRAYDLHQKGWRSIDIARALDVTPGAISQWLSAARQHGPDALRSRKAPGARPKLAPEQLQQLPALLENGPEHYGFRGNVWTCSRAVQLVKQQFGVQYSSAHMSRILKKIGWTPQKPTTRAIPARRSRHHRVARRGLARDQKKPSVRVGPSCSSTRLPCTCCQASSARTRLVAKRRSCTRP